jgi:hypothetical protein
MSNYCRPSQLLAFMELGSSYDFHYVQIQDYAGALPSGASTSRESSVLIRVH